MEMQEAKMFFSKDRKTLLLIMVFTFVGCQSITPTATYIHGFTQPVTTVTPTPEQNPVLQAFRKLEELDSYRMTVTFMKGAEIRTRYLLEKKGQGHFRIISEFFKYPTLIVDDKIYSQQPSGEWTVDETANDESYWLIFPFMTGDNGCMFDFENPPLINSVVVESTLFRETVINFEDMAGVFSDPAHQCKLTVRNGLPFLIVDEAMLEDYIFITHFTGFDGKNIESIRAPYIP